MKFLAVLAVFCLALVGCSSPLPSDGGCHPLERATMLLHVEPAAWRGAFTAAGLEWQCATGVRVRFTDTAEPGAIVVTEGYLARALAVTEPSRGRITVGRGALPGERTRVALHELGHLLVDTHAAPDGHSHEGGIMFPSLPNTAPCVDAYAAALVPGAFPTCSVDAPVWTQRSDGRTPPVGLK